MKRHLTLRFDCPKCGGSSFGSSTKDGVTTRICSGVIPTGHAFRSEHVPCNFAWTLDEDFRHFVLVAVCKPDTPEEYGALVTELREHTAVPAPAPEPPGVRL